MARFVSAVARANDEHDKSRRSPKGDYSENRKEHPRHSDWREQEDRDQSENHRPGNFGDDRSNRRRFAVAHHPIIPLRDDGGNTPASSFSRPHATVDAIAGMGDRPPIFADRSRLAAPVDSPLMMLPETFRVDQTGALPRAILQRGPTGGLTPRRSPVQALTKIIPRWTISFFR